MKAMKNLLGKLVKDESGGELMEYALIAGLVVVAAVTALGTLGKTITSKFTSVNTELAK